jgi:CHASE1-domain containing sensor protein
MKKDTFFVQCRRVAVLVVIALALLSVAVVCVVIVNRHKPAASYPSGRACPSNETKRAATRLVDELIEGNRSAEDILAELVPLLGLNNSSCSAAESAGLAA